MGMSWSLVGAQQGMVEQGILCDVWSTTGTEYGCWFPLYQPAGPFSNGGAGALQVGYISTENDPGYCGEDMLTLSGDVPVLQVPAWTGCE